MECLEGSISDHRLILMGVRLGRETAGVMRGYVVRKMYEENRKRIPQSQANEGASALPGSGQSDGVAEVCGEMLP